MNKIAGLAVWVGVLGVVLGSALVLGGCKMEMQSNLYLSLIKEAQTKNEPAVLESKIKFQVLSQEFFTQSAEVKLSAIALGEAKPEPGKTGAVEIVPKESQTKKAASDNPAPVDPESQKPAGNEVVQEEPKPEPEPQEGGTLGKLFKKYKEKTD
jgi:hypothetical protein